MTAVIDKYAGILYHFHDSNQDRITSLICICLIYI